VVTGSAKNQEPYHIEALSFLFRKAQMMVPGLVVKNFARVKRKKRGKGEVF